MEIFWFWLGIAVVTGVAGSSRGRSGFGWFILGAMFSIVALLLVLVLPSRQEYLTAPSPDTHVRCPDCREMVYRDARKCKHCGTSLIPS